MTPGILIVSIIFLGISMVVSMILKGKFKKYSKVALSHGLTGREIAEKMLRENGIFDVKVTSSQGFLSDHYNPANKTVNLSPEVYDGISVSAAAVAAHECGHAVQHATAYGPLTMRRTLVPAVQFTSILVNWVLLARRPGSRKTRTITSPSTNSSIKTTKRSSSDYPKCYSIN